MRPGELPTLSLTLTRGPGRDAERWTLLLAADSAALVDSRGGIIREFDLTEAAAAIGLPGPAAASADIRIDTGEGRERFEVEGDGLGHLASWMRSAMARADPHIRRRVLWRAVRDAATGVLALGLGAALTLATAGTSNSPRYLFVGLIVVGLVQIGRGALGAAEYRRIRQLAAEPAQNLAALAAEDNRRSWLPAIALILALTAALVIFGLVIAYATTPPKRNSNPRASAVHAPSDPAASDVPPAAMPPATTGAESPVPPPPFTAQRESVLSGACAWARPPRSLAHGQFASDSLIRIIRERQNVLLAEPLACDALDPGEFVASLASAAAGKIPAGSRIDSYLVHIDTPAQRTVHLEGQITFPSRILGLIASNAALDASDSITGVRGTAYPTGGRWRQFFDGDSGDLLSISDDRRTLSIRSHTGRWIDQVRVIIAPE